MSILPSEIPKGETCTGFYVHVQPPSSGGTSQVLSQASPYKPFFLGSPTETLQLLVHPACSQAGCQASSLEVSPVCEGYLWNLSLFSFAGEGQWLWAQCPYMALLFISIPTVVLYFLLPSLQSPPHVDSDRATVSCGGASPQK